LDLRVEVATMILLMVKSGFWTENWIRLSLIIGAVILGLLILFISMVKASCPVLASEGEIVSVEPIKYQILSDDGTLKDGVYALPHPGILPPHPLYMFKRVRDWMWLKMTKNHYKKARLLHRFADREMGAAMILSRNGETKRGMEFMEEAIKKLEEAYQEVEKEREVYEEAVQIGVQIKEAGVAYEYGAWELEGGFELDQEKWAIILERIKDFNLANEEKE
jgi:hypothetical protein